jgi:spore germination cell wall hydrolase CwlJ-like protein|tara:strand:+ start:8051 stop:8557 length:507 start_codon:yes stop_codon:yes gene_type:complete
MKSDQLLLIGAGGFALAAFMAARTKEKSSYDLGNIDPGSVSQQVDILARTIWGEARGEGAQGMQAVANVVMNRANNPGWWGHDVITVCLADKQFSAWNLNDANYSKIQTVNASDASFALALQIAGRAVAGTLPDITGGATHYHTAAVNPFWDDAMTYLGAIGRHLFYS